MATFLCKYGYLPWEMRRFELRDLAFGRVQSNLESFPFVKSVRWGVPTYIRWY